MELDQKLLLASTSAYYYNLEIVGGFFRGVNGRSRCLGFQQG